MVRCSWCDVKAIPAQARELVPKEFSPGSRTAKLALGLALLLATYKAWRKIQWLHRRGIWERRSQELVILHQIPRGKRSPNISPFALKLETYLRMTAIPYEVDTIEPKGPKGKLPWITVKGLEVADSEMCIQHLNYVYDRKLNPDEPSQEDVASARAMQIMMEEHFYWGLVMWRYVHDKTRSMNEIQKLSTPMWYMLKWSAPRRVARASWWQGTGRHSKQDIEILMVKDLNTLSSFIGKKRYLLGERPSEMDCAVFGMLAQVMWNAPGSPYETLIQGKLSNLKDYCLRIKERYWPDWDRCLDPPQAVD